MPTLTQGILAALAIFAAIVLILWLPPHQRRRKRIHVVTRPVLPPEYVPLSGGLTPPRGPGAGSQGTPHPPIHVHITHCPGCACERTPHS